MKKYKLDFQVSFYDLELPFDTYAAIKDQLEGLEFNVDGGEIQESCIEDDTFIIDDFVSVEFFAEKEKSLVDIAIEIIESIDSANAWFSITDEDNNLIYSTDCD